MLNGTFFQGDFKYVTLIGKDVDHLNMIAANAKFPALKAPICVLSAKKKDGQRPLAESLTNGHINFKKLPRNVYVMVGISQGGLFNRAGKGEIVLIEIDTGRTQTIAKYPLKPSVAKSLVG